MLPQAHRTRSPAWLISIATDLPQEQGSKYFIARSFEYAGQRVESVNVSPVDDSSVQELSPFWVFLRHRPTRAG